MTLQSILGFRECEAMTTSDLDVRFLKSQMQVWKHKTFIAARAAHIAKENLLLCRDAYRRKELEDTYEQWYIAYVTRKRIYKRNLRNHIDVKRTHDDGGL